jgi:predicted metal-dependent TIM-barrel fold hydrolase
MARSTTTGAQSVEAPAHAHANGSDPAGVIDQVRELLFGEAKRSTEHGLGALEARIGALTATMEERFSEVESRLAELARDTERAQATAIDEIGSAISQLGATIRNMSGPRKAN